MKQTRSTYLLRLFLPMFFYLIYTPLGYSQQCMPPMSVSLTPSPNPIYSGNSTTVTANVTGGMSPYMYSWAGMPGGFTSTNNPIVVSPTITTTYAVTVTDMNGCTGISDARVKVCQLQANINQPTPTVCEGSPTTLHAVGLMGCPPYTYLWSNGQMTQSITPIASHTTTHSVTVTDAFDCTATAQAAVCVNYAGFSAVPTNEVIVKPKLGVDISALAACLEGTLIDSCACDSIYLIELHNLDPADPCFLLDIEEKKKGARMEVAEESFNLNYRFEYCENQSSFCKNKPNDDTPIPSPIVVGLIDTGVDGNTSINQWQTDTLECGSSTDGIVEGGNVVGFDYTGDGNPWVDSIGHGTHLAHIIQSNDSDVHSIFNAKVISANREKSSLFGLICGMNAFNAYNQLVPDNEKVKVINLSMGMYGLRPTLLEEAIGDAEDEDVIVVCSAGNGYSDLDDEKLIVCEDTICEPLVSDTLLLSEIDTIIFEGDCGIEGFALNIVGNMIPFIDTITLVNNIDTSIVFVMDTICMVAVDTFRLNHYPSEFESENIISVTAWDYFDDELPEWANTSPVHVDLAAPGVGIRSRVSSTEVQDLDGTSQAAAFVTREIARLWAENPDADYWQIINSLDSQAVEEPELVGLTYWGKKLPNTVVKPCEDDVLVPTVSEWGLIILALILLNLGVLYIRQTQLISVK